MKVNILPKKMKLKFINRNIEKIVFQYQKIMIFVCLVTNQPSIAMGKLSLRELDEINSFVVNFCLSKGLKIDVVTFLSSSSS